MAGSVKCALFLLAGPLLASAWPAAAQVKLGETSTNLNGTVSFGYSADYGSAISSDHNWDIGGSANMSGYFYSPKFLTYNANFYLNQSRANSNFQSISNTSGVSLTSNIFGGSHFPGAISYTKAIDAEGNYDVPGLANYVTHGNNDSIGINWSESIPNVPTLTAGFQKGGGQYSVYGTNDEGTTSYHSLNLNSGYTLAGFSMGGYYNKGGNQSLLPEVLTGATSAQTETTTDAYGFNVSHRLPLHGSFAANANRSAWDTNFEGTGSTGAIEVTGVSAGLHPTAKLSVSGSASYSDNLNGQLVEAILGAGGIPTGVNSNQKSNSLDLLGVVAYTPAKNLQTNASVERRAQYYEGTNYGVNSYGAGGTYTRALFEGSLSASVEFAENVSDQSGEDNLGFSVNENYSNQVFGWHLHESVGYSQNVETLLVTYMNSVYTFSGNASRRWGRMAVSMGAAGSRTALTEQAGTASESQSYSASVGYAPMLTVSGSYSRSSGEALVTGAGLVPVGTIPLPSSLVSLYGGNGYSFALTSVPVKRLTLSASYAKSNSNTSSSGFASNNENDEYNALIQYQVRKLYFTSGYARLGQGFSSTGLPPATVSSFYAGLSRWFNFF
jgi:hypothetical protein